MRKSSTPARLTLALALALLLPAAAGAAETPWTVHPARGHVKLDGRLDEWAGGDPGALGELAWDRDALYLALDVYDTHLTFSDDTTRDFAGSDRVVLLVSTEAVASAPERGPLGERDYAFIFTPDSRYRRPLKTVYGFGGAEHVELDLRQVAVASRVTSSGYQLEVRIPWSLLHLTPEAGRELSLAVLRFDVAADHVQATDLWGRPVSLPVSRALLRRATLSGE